MENNKDEIIRGGEYSDRNNRCGGYPEYMEEYRLARGYEWRQGRLQEKQDPRCLNEHGIPTNDFNLPAVPGMNTLPMNARIATKNRYLSQIIVKGGCMVKGTMTGSPLKTNSPYLKTNYSQSDFDFLLGYFMNQNPVGNNDILDLVQDRKSEIFGKPAIFTKDGDIVINKSGSYIVQFYADIIYSQPRDTSRLDKEYVWLIHNGKVGARVQQRSCSNVDGILGLYIGGLKKGDKLNVSCGVAFTDTNIRDTYFATAINIIETS